jgi:hypothetical protein
MSERSINPRFPQANKAIFDSSEVNDNIELYSGAMRFTHGDKSATGTGAVRLSWLPFPAIRFHADTQPVERIEYFDGEPTKLELLDDWEGKDFRVDVNSTSAYSNSASTPVRGTIQEWNHEPRAELDHVLVHFIDLKKFRGTNVSDGRASYVGRAELEFDGWRVQVDKILKKDFQTNLKNARGYGVTHVGRISRNDSSGFSLEDCEQVRDGLYHFCSFCCGSWAGPSMFVGNDKSGNQVSHAWTVPRITGFRDARNWFGDLIEFNMKDLFPGFMKKWTDVIWKEAINNAIFWYVTANSANISIENGVVLNHVAFETLGWTYLVEATAKVSSGDLGNMRAAEVLRVLLVEMEIPLDIPTHFESLSAFAKSNRNCDGPKAVTLFRNAYVHPSPRNRNRLNRVGIDSQYEARELSMYYLEMILLRIFDFNGQISSRIADAEYKGGETRFVPWADKHQLGSV